jgi:epoxyqueuosine reductase
MFDLAQFTTIVTDAAHQAGFELAGIAPVRDPELPELAYFPGWIDAGRAGEMHYMQARDEHGRLRRASVEETFPWARSVVVCALSYNAAAPRSTDDAGPSRGWISRYAWGQKDYHEAVMARLRQVEAGLRAAVPEELETRCYVDTGPLVERVVATHAGLGWLGKNTCLIHPQAGSWLFLGVILTSLELEPGVPLPDRCGSCTRCLDVCPTQAFPAPYQLDASRCIAYLTIEKRGAMPEELRAGVGRHVFGCDLCQEVCPWNRKAPVTAAPELEPRPELVNPALEWLAGLSEEEFHQKFHDTAVRRTKRSGLRRNAVVAMGNSGDPSFLPQLEELAQDADPVVAEHARWARQRLERAAAHPQPVEAR